MPLWLLRFWRPLLALAVMAGCWLWFQHELSTADRQGYSRAKAEDKAAADLQQERNRDLQRQAEKRYVVEQGVRDRFHTVTVKEIAREAAPLADCKLPPALVLRFNEARSCALGDSAACGSPDGAVRSP